MKHLCYCLLLVSLHGIGSTQAQHVGGLTGRIIDDVTGDSIADVHVSLVNTHYETRSLSTGRYSLPWIPAGAYTLHLEADGYTSSIVQNVEIVADWTTRLDVALSPGAGSTSTDFERPFLPDGAAFLPNIAYREQLRSWPVRSPIEITQTYAGVVSREGSHDLFVHGGRPDQTAFYIDGVRVTTETADNIPLAALEQIRLQSDRIPVRYGDAMSGVVNLTTRSDARRLFGSLEAITSERLDPYGYNLVSGVLGGPVVKNRLHVMVSGEYTDRLDASPRSAGQLRASSETLERLRAFPISLRATDLEGNSMLLPIPASLEDNASMTVGADGLPLLTDGRLTFSDGTTVEAAGVDPTSIVLSPVISAEYVAPEDLTLEKAQSRQTYERLSLLGHISWNPFRQTRLRVGGLATQSARDHADDNFAAKVLFAPEMIRRAEQDDYFVYGTLTHRFGNSAILRLQADYTDRYRETFDPRFGDDLLEYGNIDNEAFATLRGYRDMRFVEMQVGEDDRGTPNDSSDDLPIFANVPTYSLTFRDGAGPSTGDEVVSTLVQVPGGRFNDFEKARSEQMRFSGYVAGRVGVHRLEIGGEFEQQTHRYWQIDAARLARFAADGFPEQIASGDPNLDEEGYSAYEDIPPFIVNTLVGRHYGYDITGQAEVDDESFAGFLDQRLDKPLSDYNLAPYEPMYYGGYVRDEIDLGWMTLDVGVRADVFDNNARVLKDPFSRRPICRAGDVGSVVNGVDCGPGEAPAGIGSGFAVYYQGNRVVGFRDTDGNYYDAEGLSTDARDVLLNGSTRQTHGTIIENMFADYTPQLSIQPRISLSVPIDDRTSLFAGWGIASQRPSSGIQATLGDYAGRGAINNARLTPEHAKNAYLGFFHGIDTRFAVSLTGFYRSIERLSQPSATSGSLPRTNNGAIAKVKGIEGYVATSRRNGFNFNGSYTFSIVEGSISQGLPAEIVFVSGTPPTAELYPLTFDRRHNIDLILSYRPADGESRLIFGADLLKNVDITLIAQAGSGFPYTPVQAPQNLAGSPRTAVPSGGINDTRMPWTARVDLGVNRTFEFGASGVSATVFFWVQNLLDRTNVQNVWPYSGRHDDDGFLSTEAGGFFLENRPPIAETLYRHRTRVPAWTGIPRMMRLGIRVGF